MQRSAVRPSPIFLGLIAITAGGGLLTLLESDVAITAGVVLLVLGGWVVSLCLHEFGHALVAFRGGDREVYFKGYLTLDPRRYTDPVLSLLMPVIFLAIGGIPLPGGAVWINHHALRSRAVESSVSLAGPLSNLVVAILLAVSVNVFEPAVPLAAGLSFLAVLQLGAFILNMLPVPGLDGWGALEPFLSHDARVFGAKARPWAPLFLFAALIGIPGVSQALWSVVYALFELIGGNGLLSDIGQYEFFFWQR
ncbi:site-2 protease family protein [Actinokineospora sp. HUAS TT18]|uniref:site-2 protease family protein n=1 Tax=Actinokineospora sp. HUAS TT18 TaxID=3447451 RepID=UPI003F524D3F